MVRMMCAALVLLAGIAAAEAATTRISNPDGTTVDVVTNEWGSVVTSYSSAGKRTDQLRYPAYKGDDGHERLLKLLSPPGATWDRK